MSWHNEPKRHSLASRGIRSTHQKTPTTVIKDPDDYFHTDYADLPVYDNMLKNPEYFERAKGKRFKIVYMSPDEYMDRVAEQQNTTPAEQWSGLSEKNLQHLRDYISAGNKFPLMSIENTEYAHTQEGRHRAKIAKEIGLKEVPVLLVWDIPESEYQKKYGNDNI